MAKLPALLSILLTLSLIVCEPEASANHFGAREITYRNVNTELTIQDLDLPGSIGRYTFSGLTDSLPYKVTENDLGTNNLTVSDGQDKITVKVIVTEASRKVDRDGWTIIEASEDTRIIYVSSSEGCNDTGVAYEASEIGVSNPDDKPGGDFFKKITPTSASDYTHSLGNISASSESSWDGGRYAWEAFNDKTGYRDRWLATAMPAWLQFQSNTAETVFSYAITVTSYSNRHPANWVFEGSNNGESWDVLHTVSGESGWESGERRVYSIENSSQYEYYRINVTETSGGMAVGIQYMEIFARSETIAPVRTPGRATALARDNKPDWILFKRGDSWGEGFHWMKSGRSIQESAVMGAYGPEDLNRPRFEGTRISAGSASNVIFFGFEALAIRTHTNQRAINFLYEDSYFSGPNEEGVLMSGSNAPKENLEIRRCVITENYNDQDGSGHRQGMYASSLDGLLMEENLFYYNGWKEGIQTATIFNHNIYLAANTKNVRLYRNINAEASSHGIQYGGGGLGRENVFVRNPINVLSSRGSGGDGINFIFENNLILEAARHIDRENETLGRGFGLEVGDLDPNEAHIVSGNILSGGLRNRVLRLFGRDTSEGADSQTPGVHNLEVFDNIIYNSRRGIEQSRGNFSNVNIYNNIIHASFDAGSDEHVIIGWNSFLNNVTWSNNTYYSANNPNPFRINDSNRAFSDWLGLSGEVRAKYKKVDFFDPDRTISSYQELISGQTYADNDAAFEAFIQEAMKQSRQNWRFKYTAIPIQDYIRKGFTVIEPPSEVEDLKAQTKTETDGEVLLSWTAPGKHGDKGNNKGGHYEVRYATYPVTGASLSWWNSISTDSECYYSGAQLFDNPKEAGEIEERVVRGLYPGTTFYFGVRTHNAGGQVSWLDKKLLDGDPASAATGDAYPGPPSGLRFQYIGTDAYLVWKKSPSSILDRYIVYRSTESGDYETIEEVTVSNEETEYVIDLSDPEEYFADYDRYYFAVRAENIAEKKSVYSNEVKLTPDETPPVIEDLTSRTRAIERKRIYISVTDDRQVYEVGGGYRSLGSDSESYEKLEFPEPEEGSSNYEGYAEIDDFYISTEGFEYYITASDAFNVFTTSWVQLTAPQDLPEQGFITPDNPELIFGYDVEEVLITDMGGNEVFKEKRSDSDYIVWNPSKDGSISLESGLYIYRIKTDGGYKYGSVVIAK